jgi:hypothetical protein
MPLQQHEQIDRWPREEKRYHTSQKDAHERRTQREREREIEREERECVCEREREREREREAGETSREHTQSGGDLCVRYTPERGTKLHLDAL